MVPVNNKIVVEKSNWLLLSKETALEAGAAIMDVYDSMDFSVEYKKDDSPLTRADKIAHAIITEKLATTNLPVLSEEGRAIPFEERKHWNYFWLVDPLDGTKEFIKRNKEFTVNIALVQDHRPVLGVIYAPALKWLYWSDLDGKAWKQQVNGPVLEIHAYKQDTIKRIVASKSHLTTETEQYIKQFPGASILTIGSSLKFMLVADGTADCYPRFGPTMEWDTAAAQAIAEAAGAKVVQSVSGEALYYNKENLLNPWFIVRA